MSGQATSVSSTVGGIIVALLIAAAILFVEAVVWGVSTFTGFCDCNPTMPALKEPVVYLALSVIGGFLAFWPAISAALKLFWDAKPAIVAFGTPLCPLLLLFASSAMGGFVNVFQTDPRIAAFAAGAFLAGLLCFRRARSLEKGPPSV